jgi:hypothetical protein
VSNRKEKIFGSKEWALTRYYGDDSKAIAKKYGGSSEHGSGCGLCQTGVPCEVRNPLAVELR